MFCFTWFVSGVVGHSVQKCGWSLIQSSGRSPCFFQRASYQVLLISFVNSSLLTILVAKVTSSANLLFTVLHHVDLIASEE